MPASIESSNTIANDETVCAPLAVFVACSGSHPFDERRVLVNEGDAHPVKIGRSVARWKANPNNAIFDCKVLSRNHAILFYEDGAFFIKDTKSSNGTFINNERLSKSGEESVPRQIFSGDILQLGVEIVESSNKAHGCIIAIVTLFNDRGEECANDRLQRYNTTHDVSEASNMCSNEAPLISPKQLFQMQQYIKEAMYREKTLEEKLLHLQSVLVNTVKASEDSWQALINEDRLLARIEMLEGQLALYSKSTNQDTLRQQVSSMLEDRNEFETKTKQVVQRLEEEKREANLRITDLERSLTTMESDIVLLKLKHEEEAKVLNEEIASLSLEVATFNDYNPNLEDEGPMHIVENENGDMQDVRGTGIGLLSIQTFSSISYSSDNLNLVGVSLNDPVLGEQVDEHEINAAVLEYETYPSVSYFDERRDPEPPKEPEPSAPVAEPDPPMEPEPPKRPVEVEPPKEPEPPASGAEIQKHVSLQETQPSASSALVASIPEFDHLSLTFLLISVVPLLGLLLVFLDLIFGFISRRFSSRGHEKEA